MTDWYSLDKLYYRFVLFFFEASLKDTTHDYVVVTTHPNGCVTEERRTSAGDCALFCSCICILMGCGFALLPFVVLACTIGLGISGILAIPNTIYVERALNADLSTNCVVSDLMYFPRYNIDSLIRYRPDNGVPYAERLIEEGRAPAGCTDAICVFRTQSLTVSEWFNHTLGLASASELAGDAADFEVWEFPVEVAQDTRARLSQGATSLGMRASSVSIAITDRRLSDCWRYSFEEEPDRYSAEHRKDAEKAENPTKPEPPWTNHEAERPTHRHRGASIDT